eukprot:TRINITY_DN11533_c0_g3_i1.p1 TRINITY_DN11533_c0_g3~~TRINITY_DN11533_c0_g3_i1.p1  ORF type:complete len:681 (+),score=103.70 TRINITY_DN11533_c0_g3_i1:114-2156(+)
MGVTTRPDSMKKGSVDDAADPLKSEDVASNRLRRRRQDSLKQLSDASTDDDSEVTSDTSPRTLSSQFSYSDVATGQKPRKHISLMDPGLLPKLCSCMPGLILFPLMFTVIVTAIFFKQAFYWVTAILTVYTAVYSTNLSISCAIGAWRMRRDSNTDWSATLKKLQKQDPEANQVMHFVFLPNYKEAEDMLLHTIQNLGRSAIARDTFHVVLAMEAREGPEVHAKAERLMQQTKHLFADITATFHPADIPGDMAGKSSNCQWAYRQILQKYASQIATVDASKVFLTCCDADTLFHPQFFNALTYQALCLSNHERSWSIWQPPILLMRNLFSSPAPTRVSGYATILFELAGLTNQKISPHFSFSTYSFTLALASHPQVDGWDRDVIAEDHHMFCKCYFASVWEQLEASDAGSSSSSGSAKAVKSDLKLQPVYLPAVSYLVESDDGWLASIHARFVQARRHSQGLAELSYVFLQHAHLLMSENAGKLAWSTHARILGVAGKMTSVHIIASMHSLAFMMAVAMLVPSTISWLLSQGVEEVTRMFAEKGLEGILSLQSLDGIKWVLFAIFGPIPPMSMMMTAVTFLVVLDTLEGRLTSDAAFARKNSGLAAPDIQGSAEGLLGLGWWKRASLFFMIQADYSLGAFITLFVYCLFPASLAAWSLMSKNGMGFQYIVGEKPSETGEN